MSKELSELTSEIDDIVLSFLPMEISPAIQVRQAMNYAMKSGGKRIRPTLMYLTYKCLTPRDKYNKDVIEPFMAAIEMIHTSSLIHDDLPAIDNDDLRRGKPSVHKAFGEAAGILSGDMLLNYAYEIAAKSFTVSPGDENVEKAFTVLLNKTGLYGMLGGQSADVMLTGQEITEEDQKYIYLNKTAALIEAPLMIGAILSGERVDISALEEAGRRLGLAFQVRDDILDVTGTEEKLGKEIGQDSRNCKSTYVAVHGIEASNAFVNEQTDIVLDLIRSVLKPEKKSPEEDSESREAYYMMKNLIKSLAGREF